MTKVEVFDPVAYSIEENQFLLDSVGKPPISALSSLPPKVNAKAVEPILDTLYQYGQAESFSGFKWVGLAAVKSAISAYLEQAALWVADRRRGAPRFPSMHTYDSRGRNFKGAVGSDSLTVKTYFTKEGTRKKFAVDLIPNDAPTWSPSWAVADAPKASDGITIDEAKNRIECLVCGHTESFKPESRASLTAAKGRISKHLRHAKDEPERHRETLHKVFGS